MADADLELLATLMRRKPGSTTVQLRQRLPHADLGTVRGLLQQLLAAGRAVCLNGRWFPREGR